MSRHPYNDESHVTVTPDSVRICDGFGRDLIPAGTHDSVRVALPNGKMIKMGDLVDFYIQEHLPPAEPLHDMDGGFYHG